MTTFFPKIEGSDDRSIEIPPVSIPTKEMKLSPAGSALFDRKKKTTAKKIRESRIQGTEKRSGDNSEDTDLSQPSRLPKAKLPEALLEDLKPAPVETSRPGVSFDEPVPSDGAKKDARRGKESAPVSLAEKPASAPPVEPPSSAVEMMGGAEPQEDHTLASALHGLKTATDLSNCLVPLLEALSWRGHPRHVAESIPHFLDSLDITSFRNIFANLRYESWRLDLSLPKIDRRLMPCLYHHFYHCHCRSWWARRLSSHYHGSLVCSTGGCCTANDPAEHCQISQRLFQTPGAGG